jgi:membrane protein required for colicin V production
MPIDIILLAVFGYGFYHGFTRGIISTVFNIFAYVLGVVMAFKITPVTNNILERLFNSENPLMFVAAFILNLVVLMFILRQAAKGMEGFLRAIYLGLFNQVFGGILVAGTYVLIYSVLLWFLVKVGFMNDQTVTESRSYPYLKDLPIKAKAVAMRLKPVAGDVWDTSIGLINRLETYGMSKTETKPKVYEMPDENTQIEAVPQTTTPATGKKQAAPPPRESNGIEQ